MEKTKGKYDDIINLPHHTSETRKHMSMHDRAAQFAPFAALTGFDEEIDMATQAEIERVAKEVTNEIYLGEA